MVRIRAVMVFNRPISFLFKKDKNNFGLLEGRIITELIPFQFTNIAWLPAYKKFDA